MIDSSHVNGVYFPAGDNQISQHTMHLSYKNQFNRNFVYICLILSYVFKKLTIHIII